MAIRLNRSVDAPRRALGIIVAGLLMAGASREPAAANPPPLTEENITARVRNVCTPDAQRLCPEHALGSTEMRYCMEAKQRSISRDCQIALEDDGVVPRGHFTSKRR